MLFGLVALCVQGPFVDKYKSVESYIGTFRNSDAVFRSFSASLVTPFQHEGLLSLPQRLFRFYPRVSAGIEGSGYTGALWGILFFWGFLQCRNLRSFGVLAAFFFLISMGPSAGVFYVTKIVPGFSALRAIGRMQILYALFSIPLILGALVELKKFRPLAGSLGILLLLLELCPGSLPQRTDLAFLPYDTSHSAKVHSYERLLPKTALPWAESVWVLPLATAMDQLVLNALGKVVIGGYSGRSPKNFELLYRLGLEAKEDVHKWQQLLDSTHVSYVTSSDSEFKLRLRRLSRDHHLFEELGCESLGGSEFCAFRTQAQNTPARNRVISLEEDTQWLSRVYERGFYRQILSPQRTGLLRYEDLGLCRVQRNLHWHGWLIFKKTVNFPSDHLQNLEFSKGESIHEFSFEIPSRLHEWTPSLTPSWKIVCSE